MNYKKNVAKSGMIRIQGKHRLQRHPASDNGRKQSKGRPKSLKWIKRIIK